jgi:hypothetical protein
LPRERGTQLAIVFLYYFGELPENLALKNAQVSVAVNSKNGSQGK